MSNQDGQNTWYICIRAIEDNVKKNMFFFMFIGESRKKKQAEK